jgi:hypothetical protein
MLKRILYLLSFVLIAGQVLAQVTTSNITGTVKGSNGDALTGATVAATHEPTGTVYRTTSRAGGRFDIQNIVPGGPYNIKVSYVGFDELTQPNINIPLGETYDLQAELIITNKQLTEVVVSGTRAGTLKTGAATNFSRRVIQNTPNIGRSITGLTRNTPQANGNSFTGMNNRYNNITIDGALFNNNFGRSGDGMIPGGGASAISIDALDQIQVNIAPYDVRQAGFVGAGINAVTRRGTNTYSGTVYGFYRNQNFNGEKVNDVTITNSKRSTKVYGASVGGPIIKNKLFFFVNAERELRTLPGQSSVARRPGQNDSDPNIASPLASDLDKLSKYLLDTYQYEAGAYEGYDFATENFKYVVRLDWNISDKHRLTVRYNGSETDDDDRINASSGPASATRFSNSRGGGSKTAGLNFNGSNFKNNTKVSSSVLELNSALSNKVSNQLIATYTKNQPIRVPNSTFPFVDIMNGANVYTSFGTDLFSYENKIDDQAYNIADNVTLNLGAHIVTGGASYDYFKVANFFSDAGGPSYYRFASLQDFLDNKAPSFFALTYSYDQKNPGDIPPAAATFGQIGLYAQDAWSVNNRFKLTYGLRVDKPLYNYDAPRNPALEALLFKDEEGKEESFDVSKWPKSRVLFSPRIGFSYDPEGDKNLIIRGGSGIFTGRIPFIWLTNQVADNGVLRSIFQVSSAADLANYKFSPNRTDYLKNITIPAPGTAIPSGRPSYSATSPDFKMPQVWRTNLAFDKKLATDYTFTLEAIFTKTINNVFFRNANLGIQNGMLNNVGDNRPAYNTRLNDNIALMTVLDNVNKGFSTSVTGQVQKSFTKNWEGFLAYTYTFAQDLNIGTSDRASSSWTTNPIIRTPNEPELGFSNFSIPHRIIANFSYKFEYLHKKLATTVGVYYSASSQERYHFRYGADVNGDAQSNDLLFVPANPSDINFAASYTPVSGGPSYTAQQQKDLFFAFIEKNSYLKKHKGQYVERYGALLPWVHSLDLRLLQDFSFNALDRKHTFQFTVDATNFLNMLNNSWGVRYRYNYSSFSDQPLLGLASGFNKSAPVYTFNPVSTKVYDIDYSTNSTWGIQLGLRYIF